MLKRFSISLIVISSAVYMTIFLMSRHYQTGFFDEILIQLNRLNTSLGHKTEIIQTKYILKLVSENDTPTKQWYAVMRPGSKTDPTQLFYYYKVWLIKAGLTQTDINQSYPIFRMMKDDVAVINMRYGPGKPIVQFPFSKTGKDSFVCGLFFPINEPPFSADLNKDKTVDQKDVVIAAAGSQS